MYQSLKLFVASLVFILFCVDSGNGQRLAVISPEEAGVSSPKLEQLTSFAEELVNDNKLPGCVTAVAKDGKVVYLKCVGMSDVENAQPMRKNTIFRICSMSKPIASVALMILYDEGKVKLDDPVSKFIPELAELEVATSFDPLTTERANKAITIKQILTHTAGFYYSSGTEMPGVIYRRAGLAEGVRQEPVTLEENMKTLAGLPLAFQPGSEWRYGVNTDVVGRVVEVASGMSLDEFLKRRIFAPLKMEDTCFYLPKPEVRRLAAAYRLSADRRIERLEENRTYDLPGYSYSADYPYRGPKKYFSGNAGLCSTVPDYVRFSQMLLNGGQLDGERILERETVDLMLKNHIGELRTVYGQKFGLGFQITDTLNEGEPEALRGCCGWGGFFTTVFTIHPEDNWLVVSMSQVAFDMEFFPAWCARVLQLAAGAVDK
jgi:CubicO group peptidase (beta-lactamase class C family)